MSQGGDQPPPQQQTPPSSETAGADPKPPPPAAPAALRRSTVTLSTPIFAHIQTEEEKLVEKEKVRENRNLTPTPIGNSVT